MRGETLARAAAVALLAASLTSPARAQEPPTPDPAEILNALLAGLLGMERVTPADLRREVEEVGGVAFRAEVPLEYLSPEDAARYLDEVLDDEYPERVAAIEARALCAFGLLPEGTDLRALRRRLLRENVVGFYDDRPGRRRLYAVSAERELTPSNQMILAHELRHALQDQHAPMRDRLAADVSDFDDRRLAHMSLLEGDATLVMERFLARRLGREGEALPGPALSVPEETLADVPPVLRDQLVQPYVAGLALARELLERRGWPGLRAAWSDPPASTEQVLHPEKFLDREPPRPVTIGFVPPRGAPLAEGVLGELLTRTLLGPASERAAAGWGGDAWRLWDVGGRSLLVWLTLWDRPGDAAEFRTALETRLARTSPASSRRGALVYREGRWIRAVVDWADGVAFAASDDDGQIEAFLLDAQRSRTPVAAAGGRPVDR